MSYQRIAVVRGGPSSEYEISMQTGAQVLRALQELGYAARDVVVTKQGEWLEHGIVYQPAAALATADIVFIAMHGAYGEDGTIQRICERLHIPFTGSNSLASGTAYNKHLTKQLLAGTHIALPQHILVTADHLPTLSDDTVPQVLNWTDGFILKPINSGSSHGVEVIFTPEELVTRLHERLASEPSILLEERIVGTEATCGVLENFRGDAQYILPVIEITPPSSATHFDARVKYNGETEEICPGRFSYAEKAAMSEATTFIHTHLGLSHYSRADYIVRNGQPYFLEINSLPGLTSQSLYPKAAQAIGLEFTPLIQHLVQTATVR